MSILKRFSALILAIIMVLSLAACGDDEETSSSKEPATEASTRDDSDINDDSSVVDLPFLDASSYIDSRGYYKDVTATELVTLADISAITIPHDVYTISDEELQSSLEYIASQSASEKQVTDREVADGDTVHIVYTGYIDGEAFAGGATGDSGTDVTIGVTSYIDDFLEQLIGHKPGETVDVNVTFPTPYQNNPDLEGKDALFVVSIRYIVETVTPEIDDDFVKKNYIESGWSTLEDLKQGIRDSYRETKSKDYVTQYLQENSTVAEIPEVAENYGRVYFEWSISLSAANSNYPVDSYVAAQGYDSIDAYYEANKDSLNDSIKLELIFQAIAEQQEFVPTMDDVQAFLKDYYGEKNFETYYENFEKTMSTEAMLHSVIASLLTEKLVAFATFAEQ